MISLSDSPALTLRQAKAEDAADIQKLIKRAFAQYEGRVRPPLKAFTLSRHQIRRDIKKGARRYAIARFGRTAVGTIRFRIHKHHITLSRLAVRANYRHRGLGRMLLRWGETQGTQLGKKKVRGQVRSSMVSLIAYYQSLGYRVVGHRSKPGFPNYLTVIEKSFDARVC